MGGGGGLVSNYAVRCDNNIVQKTVRLDMTLHCTLFIYVYKDGTMNDDDD